MFGGGGLFSLIVGISRPVFFLETMPYSHISDKTRIQGISDIYDAVPDLCAICCESTRVRLVWGQFHEYVYLKRCIIITKITRHSRAYRRLGLKSELNSMKQNIKKRVYLRRRITLNSNNTITR